LHFSKTINLIYQTNELKKIIIINYVEDESNYDYEICLDYATFFILFLLFFSYYIIKNEKKIKITIKYILISFSIFYFSYNFYRVNY
jgi:hypothetical protein